MNTNPNELMLIYNPKTTNGKQTIAYAKSICNHINERDITKDPITHTQWLEITNKLGIEPIDLLPNVEPHIECKDIEDQVKIIVHKQHEINIPIAYFKNRIMLVDTPSKILSLIN